MRDLGDLCAGGYDTSIKGRDLALKILPRLEPNDVSGFRKLRIGGDNDGGYVMLDDFDGINAAYSLGINDDVSWDLAMATRGMTIYQYDHTIDTLPQNHPRFRFKPIGISGKPDPDNSNMFTLAELMRANRHLRSPTDMILKCDIEGAEWEMLATLEPTQLRRFRQIVIELHGLRDLYDDCFASLAEQSIWRLTASHRVVHVHGNNYAGYAVVGGVPIPNVLELTLARIDAKRFTRPRLPFPTRLDQPNHPGHADHALGMFRFR